MTAHLLSAEYLVEDFGSKGLFGKIEDGRETNDHTGVEPISVSSTSHSDQFLVDDHFAAGQCSCTGKVLGCTYWK